MPEPQVKSKSVSRAEPQSVSRWMALADQRCPLQSRGTDSFHEILRPLFTLIDTCFDPSCPTRSGSSRAGRVATADTAGAWTLSAGSLMAAFVPAFFFAFLLLVCAGGDASEAFSTGAAEATFSCASKAFLSAAADAVAAVTAVAAVVGAVLVACAMRVGWVLLLGVREVEAVAVTGKGAVVAGAGDFVAGEEAFVAGGCGGWRGIVLAVAGAREVVAVV